MTALRGADALERAFSIVTQPRVVCIKFRPRPVSMTSVVSPPPSWPSSPISDELKTNVQEPLVNLDFASDVKQTTESEDLGEYAHDPDDACKGGGEWIVLDMLDDHGEFSFPNFSRWYAIECCQRFRVFSASSTVKLPTRYRRRLSPRHLS